ncbi:uncharacterized protein WM277_015233 [Molossus nigricans]
MGNAAGSHSRPLMARARASPTRQSLCPLDPLGAPSSSLGDRVARGAAPEDPTLGGGPAPWGPPAGACARGALARALGALRGSRDAPPAPPTPRSARPGPWMSGGLDSQALWLRLGAPVSALSLIHVMCETYRAASRPRALAQARGSGWTGTAPAPMRGPARSAVRRGREPPRQPPCRGLTFAMHGCRPGHRIEERISTTSH